MVSLALTPQEVAQHEDYLVPVNSLNDEDVATLLECWSKAVHDGMKWYQVRDIRISNDNYFYFLVSTSEASGDVFDLYSFIRNASFSKVDIIPQYAKGMVRKGRGVPTRNLWDAPQHGQGTGGYSFDSGTHGIQGSRFSVGDDGDDFIEDEEDISTGLLDDDDSEYTDSGSLQLTAYDIRIDRIGQSFQVIEGSNCVLGRSESESDVQVVGNRRLSRKHAEFSIEDGDLYIADLGSSNHTYLDGMRLVPYEKVRLEVGSRLEMGGESFLVENKGSAN